MRKTQVFSTGWDKSGKCIFRDSESGNIIPGDYEGLLVSYNDGRKSLMQTWVDGYGERNWSCLKVEDL